MLFYAVNYLGVTLVIKLIQRDRNRKLKKEVFIIEQMKNYDQRILQMLIVKAEYEEIKFKLKNEFGLDDKGFSLWEIEICVIYSMRWILSAYNWSNSKI